MRAVVLVFWLTLLRHQDQDRVKWPCSACLYGLLLLVAVCSPGCSWLRWHAAGISVEEIPMKILLSGLLLALTLTGGLVVWTAITSHPAAVACIKRDC
jgi:hypothetical protein